MSFCEVITKPEVKDYNLTKQEQEYNLSKHTLLKEIIVPDEAISKIQTYIQQIFERNIEIGITFYNSQPSHRIFALKEAPHLIFKMNLAQDSSMNFSFRTRYNTMI
nr:hypothetical protein [Parachlamydiaceae bacterium]